MKTGASPGYCRIGGTGKDLNRKWDLSQSIKSGRICFDISPSASCCADCHAGTGDLRRSKRSGECPQAGIVAITVKRHALRGYRGRHNPLLPAIVALEG